MEGAGAVPNSCPRVCHRELFGQLGEVGCLGERSLGQRRATAPQRSLRTLWLDRRRARAIAEVAPNALAEVAPNALARQAPSESDRRGGPLQQKMLKNLEKMKGFIEYKD